MTQAYTLKPLEWELSKYGTWYTSTRVGSIAIEYFGGKYHPVSSNPSLIDGSAFTSEDDAKTYVEKAVLEAIMSMLAPITSMLIPVVDPLDDETLITDEWLNSLPGYIKHPNWGEWISLQYRDALTVEKEQDGVETWYWIDGLSNDVREFRIKTRGQLRTAFKLFGVPMQEKSNP